MKILVIAGRYGISGVPLAQLRFARALRERNHNIDLIYGMINKDHKLPELTGVRVITFNKSKVRDLLLPLIRYFLVNKPDVVFSAGDHLNVIVLLAVIFSKSNSKVSCSSRVTPYDTYSNNYFSKGYILKLFTKITMWRADVMTCVSKDMVLQYKKIFKNAPHVHAYNIIDDKISRNRLLLHVEDEWIKKKEKIPLIIAAGSLEKWKGFNDLLYAVKIAKSKVPLRLLILGEGPERNSLEKIISSYDMHNYVRLIGNVENPLAYFSHADVFVLSSYVEGMPNVLVEAMMCGCTPVSTDCQTGPRELLEDSNAGILVPVKDPEALAKGIIVAIERPTPVKVLNTVVSNFHEDAVIKRHFDLLGLN